MYDTSINGNDGKLGRDKSRNSGKFIGTEGVIIQARDWYNT